MQLNNLKSLTIPEGQVLSVYSSDEKNYYPIANAFSPDNYEAETEVKITSFALRSKKANPGNAWLATITLSGANAGEAYIPILYDATAGVAANRRILSAGVSARGQITVQGQVLYPSGAHMLYAYAITPQGRIISTDPIMVTVN